jgi:hypothetical protein
VSKPSKNLSFYLLPSLPSKTIIAISFITLSVCEQFNDHCVYYRIRHPTMSFLLFLPSNNIIVGLRGGAVG